MVGIGPDDGEDDVRYLCEKLVKLRIFDDEAGVMNRSVVDAGGDVLVPIRVPERVGLLDGRYPGTGV